MVTERRSRHGAIEIARRYPNATMVYADDGARRSTCSRAAKPMPTSASPRHARARWCGSGRPTTCRCSDRSACRRSTTRPPCGATGTNWPASCARRRQPSRRPSSHSCVRDGALARGELFRSPPHERRGKGRLAGTAGAAHRLRGRSLPLQLYQSTRRVRRHRGRLHQDPAREAGLRLQLVPAKDWSSLERMVLAHEVDLIAAGMQRGHQPPRHGLQPTL